MGKFALSLSPPPPRIHLLRGPPPPLARERLVDASPRSPSRYGPIFRAPQELRSGLPAEAQPARKALPVLRPAPVPAPPPAPPAPSSLLLLSLLPPRSSLLPPPSCSSLPPPAPSCLLRARSRGGGRRGDPEREDPPQPLWPERVGGRAGRPGSALGTRQGERGMRPGRPAGRPSGQPLQKVEAGRLASTMKLCSKLSLFGTRLRALFSASWLAGEGSIVSSDETRLHLMDPLAETSHQGLSFRRVAS